MPYHRLRVARATRGTTRRVGLALVAAVPVALAASHALAADDTVTAQNSSYGPPPLNRATIPQGGSLDFRNDDSILHDVVARERGPDGDALFRSATFAGPATRGVGGVQYLPTGNYAFFCTVHPTDMTGTLEVTSSGEPAARPDIEVSIRSKSLDRVVNSRRLLVKVRALTTAKDVSLVARKGARVIARDPDTDLVAGTSRTIKLIVTKSGRNRLDDLNAAKIKLSGSVPFGEPDTARRTLR